jgi:hypothetical protein
VNTTTGPETIITASIMHQNDADFVKSLTAYSAASKRPPGVSAAMWTAYGDRYPGSGKRWLDQEAERRWAVAAARPSLEVTRTTRICETCKAPYGSKEHHGARYCSRACFRNRVRPPKVVPTPAEVLDEMTRAYAAFVAFCARAC